MRRRAPLLLLLFAALVLGGWGLLRPGPGATAGPADLRPPAATPDGAAPPSTALPRPPRALGVADPAAPADARLPVVAAGEEPPSPEPRPATAPGEEGEVLGPLPPDPVEVGECTLELYLVDAATGERVQGEVELWRLDAPGNSDWSRGDQLQRSVAVTPEGLVVEGLPAGAYRPFVRSAARGSEHAPAFTVQGAWSTHHVAVEVAGAVAAWLLVLDDEGRRVEAAELAYGTRSHALQVNLTPPWRVAREVLKPTEHAGFGGGIGGSSGRGYWQRGSAEARGFALRPLLRDTRYRHYAQEVRVRVGGGHELRTRLRLDAPREGPAVFAVPYVAPARLLRGVRLPDGTPVAAGDVELRVEVEPVRVVDAEAAELVRDALHRVRLSRPGCVDLSYEWRAADEAAVNHELIPTSDPR